MRGSAAFRAAVAPGGVLAGPWVKNELWRRARAVPSLDLRFADNKSLVDAVSGGSLVTFTRASSGTYVGSDGLIKTATTNEARFDHNPTTGESLGLLVEEQRTNLQGNSELLTTASWSLSSATIAASGTGPNGGTAYEITETTTTSTHSFAGGGVGASSITSVTSGSIYTGSIFLKQSTVDWIQLSMGGAGFGTTLYINFNLATGAVGNSSGCTGTITPFANGWYRCTITATASTTTSLTNNVVIGFTNNTNATSRLPSYAGSTANKFFATMGQFELGSFATSYIPTTTSTVTRSADVASITGANFSSWYRQDEGTVFTQTQLQRQNATTGAAMCGIETGVGFAEAIYMHYRTNGTSAFSVYDNLILQADFSPYSSAISAGTIVNQAGAYKLNDSVGIGGGVEQTTDTVCSVPTPDRLLIGFSTAANNYLSGTIRRLTYWPSRLANSTLVEITR